MHINAVWLTKAINFIWDGSCNKIEKDNVTVYRVKDIIRVDIKDPKKAESK